MTGPDSLGEAPTMREAVAKALYMSAVKQAQEQIGAEVFPTERIVTVFEKAALASDREASIIIFCLVDDLTAEFFRRKLTGKVSSDVEEAFLSGNGMLASAHSKIALLAGLEWITTETYRNLTMMRKIRNEFAHHVGYNHFDERPICNYIETMNTKEEQILDCMDQEKRPKKLLLRSKFLVRSTLSVFVLVREMATIQAAIAHKVHPRSLFGDYDAGTQNVKELSLITSDIVLKVIYGQAP